MLIISRYAGVSYALIHGRNRDIEKLTTILTLLGDIHEQKALRFVLFKKPPFSEHDGCNDTPPVGPRLVPNEK